MFKVDNFAKNTHVLGQRLMLETKVDLVMAEIFKIHKL